ncbi:MAG: hypothetical protein II623_08090, partial [Paludibacteraceae bacterium]|nr:hypothetical protein [Paludibacteraceae bacterium]
TGYVARKNLKNARQATPRSTRRLGKPAGEHGILAQAGRSGRTLFFQKNGTLKPQILVNLQNGEYIVCCVYDTLPPLGVICTPQTNTNIQQ